MRAYQRMRSRLLLWCSLGFTGLALNNFLLVIDLIVLPEMNLLALRRGSAWIAVSVLLGGLIWDTE